MRRRLEVVAVASIAALGAAEPPVWDFIVVGAGTGGSLCAGYLADAGSSVLLLEAGSWDSPEFYVVGDKTRWVHTAWHYPMQLPPAMSLSHQPGQRHTSHHGKVMGGSSMVHGDVYDKPPVREFEYAGIKSWTGERVAAAFAKIEDDLSINYSGYDPDKVPAAHYAVYAKLSQFLGLDYVSPTTAANDNNKVGLALGWWMFRSCPSSKLRRDYNILGLGCERHTSYRDAVGGKNESESNEAPITVLANSLVSRVLLQDRKAVGVELLRYGQTHKVFARRGVILAAGAAGTPKVLILSGIGDPLDLQRLRIPIVLANREVGRELADHLAHFGNFVVKVDEWNDLLCDRRERMNVFYNTTGPAAGGDGPIEGEARFYSSCNKSVGVVEFGFEVVLLSPSSRGRVVVQSANPEVLPTMDFPRLWPSDFSRLAEVMKKVGDALGLKDMDLKTQQGRMRELEEDIENNAYLYQHLCCSARVAPEGEPGVLNEDLQVRGVEGLFVADASALPFPPSCHTASTALLMGAFAAESALKTPHERPLPLDIPGVRTKAELLDESGPTAQLQIPTVRLHHGLQTPPVEMPQIALGTGTIDRTRLPAAVASFLQLGGRHFDTAMMYDSYKEIKLGIESSGLSNMSDLFFTGKVMPFGREEVKKAVSKALSELGVAAIDVFLLHWPGDISSGKLLHGQPLPPCAERQGEEVHWLKCRLESYAALDEEMKAGRVRAIGVSNFALRHLDDLLEAGFAPPAVHQLELHPYWHDEPKLERAKADRTQLQAYGCLGGAHMQGVLVQNLAARKIALAHNVTPAQVLLRYANQRGAAVITGGSSDVHIQENLNIFSFELNEVEMEFLNQLPDDNQKKLYGPMPEEVL